ncbi:MAG TPA: class I SAM-dependent methyltransferase [Thermoanaerobaculia bacterium]|nr:class I SAM-dependent methyltransferase [Thermoanaerobaculia bacterium]
MPDFYDARSTRYYRNCEIALLQRELGPLAGKKVLKLDLWNEAINTRILNWMEEQGAEVYGLDLSHQVTSRAKGNSRVEGNHLHLVNGDIREVPFASESFDVVYTMGTIEHIAEYRHAIGEVHRVLKPGGTAIIGVPYKWDLFLRPLLVAVLDLFGKYPYSPEKSFSAGGLRKDIEGSGLTVVKRTGILTIPGILRMADVFCFTRGIRLTPLMSLMIRPFEIIETRWEWPGRFGYLLTMAATRGPARES